MQKSPEELRTDFWNSDKLQGGIIRTQYEEIKKVLKNADWNWVNLQLKTLKQHAIEQTDFYKDYKPDDVFPVVNKILLMQEKGRFEAHEGFLTPLHTVSTSGSTGTPLSVVQDYKKRNRTIADLKVFGEMCNYPSHERMLYFRTLSRKGKKSPEQEARDNIYYIDCSDMGDSHLEEMKLAILDMQPRIIFGYSSNLTELGKYIARTGRPTYGFPSVKSVLTGGEALPEGDRKLLEEIFQCTVYRRYSDMELGILSQDSGNGTEYFLNYGSFYFEILKLNADEPAEQGEVGRIVVTDLFNYAFPMIRYDTGDLGIMVDDENGGFPRLKEVYGRQRDCIYTVDGKLLSPSKISVSMWGAQDIRQWQFIQETKNEYILKLNCNREISTEKYVLMLKEILGEAAEIKIEIVDDIPVMASNKRRAVICNYSGPQ